ncbi:MAG TPA: HXXEE domain-containing protein [Nevskiaceae bacterium]|nr:HXXEE domain-containing protein [Nevskiaceae bacterium]
MLARLISYWVYGGLLAGILLLVLSPLLVSGWPLPAAAAFLLLPAYMIHQYEEHDHDRFRLFFNATIGKGFDVLSPVAVFVTNVPVVWGVIALSLYAAVEISLGWALIAVYLVIVNAFVHIIHAIIFRRYNPGLVTAVLVFLPLGIWVLHLVDSAGAGSVANHAVGLVVAVAIHAVLLVHVRRKLATMQRAHEDVVASNSRHP